MDYQLYFEIAIAIFNENVGSDFTVDNVVLDYLTSDNQKQVFERFCAEYFPYRLKDPYEEEGYFDFYATAFVSKKLGGKDGILLHTDIPYTPAELIHVLLHELAHIFAFTTNWTVQAFTIPTAKGTQIHPSRTAKSTPVMQCGGNVSRRLSPENLMIAGAFLHSGRKSRCWRSSGRSLFQSAGNWL